jgi:hypothetical protein
VSDADQLQALVDGLAVRLGRAVSLEDPRLRLIAYSQTDDDADPVRRRSILRRESPEDVRAWLFDHGLHELAAPAVLPAVPDLGMRERVVCPVRHEGALLGYLWVQEAGAPAMTEAAAVAAEAGTILYRRRLEDTATRAAEVAALERAVYDEAAGPVGVVRVAGLDDAAIVDRQAALEQALRRRTGGAGAGGGGRCLHRGGELVLAGGGEADLRAALAAAHAPAGLGPDLRIARRAALLAELLHREQPTTPADVPLEAHVLAAAGDDPAAIAVPPLAQALLAADADLAHTLETYLDHGGDIAATTAALSVSRAGLYRRLHRAEAAAGFTLHDGAAMTLLHLGLKAARLTRPPG